MEDIKRIIEALSDPLPAMRTSAVQEVGKLKIREAVDIVINLLEKDPSPLVRDNAAFTLGELKDSKAIPHLIKALKDNDEWVKKSAAKALGILRAKEAFNALLDCLKDSSPTVRRTAARSLGQIGDKRAINHLHPLLNDEKHPCKKICKRCLKHARKMKKIAIIGGGPAGLSSAIHLSQGLISSEVHLFERGEIGENIICAEGLFDFFNTLNLDLPEVMRVKRLIISDLEDIYVNLPSNSYFITFSRKLWQKSLKDKALSFGVKVYENHRIDKNDIEKFMKDYDFVLDCSGFYGITHFLLPKKEISQYRKNLVPALQYEIEGDFSDFDGILYAKIFNNPPGYFWLFPRKSDNRLIKANAGLGVLMKRKPMENLKNLLDRTIQEHLLEHNHRITKYSASPIPTRRLKNYKVRNTILLGDALGLCSPLHGGGIDTAYLSGYYVAQSIIYNNFSIYEEFLRRLDSRFFKERIILRLWSIFGSSWVLNRLKNKGLFANNIDCSPFSGKWLKRALVRMFF